jgi:prepilin-type processing-associated H-X9-DG protein
LSRPRPHPVGVPPSSESAASSFHPGGINVALADGSVRFIKDTISTLPFSQTTGIPTALIASPNGSCPNSAPLYSFQAGTQLGVWQALSTRSGGEVISADSY